MPLHDVLKKEIIWVWRFYDAVNARRGKMHLIKIPMIKQIIFTAPRYIYNEAEREAWTELQQAGPPNWRIPFRVQTEHPLIKKYCRLTQRADTWSLTYDWNTFRRWDIPTRGICSRCLEFARTLPDEFVFGPNAPENINQRTYGQERTPPIYEETDFADWIREAQGFEIQSF